MRGMLRIAVIFSLSAAAIIALSCTTTKVHRIAGANYDPKPVDAPIETFAGKIDRPYENIAVVDSKVYTAKETAQKDQMLEDLRVAARQLGADAIQDVRILPVKHRGMVPDKQVPIPGAVKQGYYRHYFMRGEAVKYVEKVGEAPLQPLTATAATSPTLPTLPAPQLPPAP